MNLSDRRVDTPTLGTAALVLLAMGSDLPAGRLDLAVTGRAGAAAVALMVAPEVGKTILGARAGKLRLMTGITDYCAGFEAASVTAGPGAANTGWIGIASRFRAAAVVLPAVGKDLPVGRVDLAVAGGTGATAKALMIAPEIGLSVSRAGAGVFRFMLGIANISIGIEEAAVTAGTGGALAAAPIPATVHLALLTPGVGDAVRAAHLVGSAIRYIGPGRPLPCAIAGRAVA